MSRKVGVGLQAQKIDRWEKEWGFWATCEH
jgi:hypothetical protein